MGLELKFLKTPLRQNKQNSLFLKHGGGGGIRILTALKDAAKTFFK